jgi:NodT family efflux transporter outer membrane factor (OMF) lipoprotein
MIRIMSITWFMVALCVVLAACAVGPEYVRPAAPVPEVYKEMGDWKVAQPGDTTIKGKWWSIFDDPLLTDLVEQVNISNQTVLAAEAQYRQAMALVQAAHAAYFPTLTAGAAFTRTLRSSTVTQRADTGGTLTSDYLLPVNVSWELDLWGRIRRTVEAARSGAQASAADLESIRLSVQAALAQTYFQLRTVDAQMKLLNATVDAYKKAFELAQNRYDSGVAGKTDVLQAETQLKSSQAQLIDLGVQRSQLEHAIAMLIGKPASVFTLAPMPLAVTPPPIPVGVPSELLERRPDIAGAERRMAAANAQIGVAKAAYFPNVTLSALGGYESSNSATWLSWPSHFWALGPAIAETLFDGGLRSAQSAQAKAAYDGTVAFYRQTVLTGFQEVEDNLAASRILEEEAIVQDAAVIAAQQALTVTLNQYKAGTVGYLNVIVAQTIAFTNERTAVDIAGRRMTAAILLIKALGGGWGVAPSLHPTP